MKFTSLTILTAVVTFIAVAGNALADRRLMLAIPGRADVDASAVLTSGGTLWVNHNGSVQRYERAPRHDAVDGRYAAFACAKRGKLIRLPVSGNGPVQLHHNGRWSNSKMLVSTLNAPPANPHPKTTAVGFNFAFNIRPENVQPIMQMANLSSPSPASVTNYTRRNYGGPLLSPALPGAFGGANCRLPADCLTGCVAPSQSTTDCLKSACRGSQASSCNGAANCIPFGGAAAPNPSFNNFAR